MTNKLDVPEDVRDYCMLAVMSKIGAGEMFEVFAQSIQNIMEKEGDERAMSIVGFMAGVMSFGFYLGMDETINALVNIAEEWDSAGRPDNFLEKKIANLKSNFSKN